MTVPFRHLPRSRLLSNRGKEMMCNNGFKRATDLRGCPSGICLHASLPAVTELLVSELNRPVTRQTSSKQGTVLWIAHLYNAYGECPLRERLLGSQKQIRCPISGHLHPPPPPPHRRMDQLSFVGHGFNESTPVATRRFPSHRVHSYTSTSITGRCGPRFF